MCENPYILDKQLNRTSFDTQSTIEDARRGSSLPRIGTAPAGAHRDSIGGRGFDVGANKGYVMSQASSLDENRIVLYKKGRSLG